MYPELSGHTVHLFRFSASTLFAYGLANRVDELARFLYLLLQYTAITMVASLPQTVLGPRASTQLRRGADARLRLSRLELSRAHWAGFRPHARTSGRYASAARAFISPTAFEQTRGGALGAGGGRVGFAGGGLSF